MQVLANGSKLWQVVGFAFVYFLSCHCVSLYVLKSEEGASSSQLPKATKEECSMCRLQVSDMFAQSAIQKNKKEKERKGKKIAL